MATVAVLAEPRYFEQLQPAGLITELKLRGHDVHVIETAYTAGDNRWLADLDVVVARGRSWDLLAMLSAAEAYGVPTINPRASISAVHNKADMAFRLAAGRIPVPRTWVGTIEQLLNKVEYPLIVKPVFGDNGRGLQIVRSAAELRAIQTTEAVIAQQYLANDGFDVKLYGIGSDVWVVRKPSPLAPDGSAVPEMLPITREARELARRCGKLFGLQLYGVDCIATPRGLVVIEVNDYPNYTGILEADDRIARCVEHHVYAQRAAVAS